MLSVRQSLFMLFVNVDFFFSYLTNIMLMRALIMILFIFTFLFVSLNITYFTKNVCNIFKSASLRLRNAVFNRSKFVGGW